MIRVLVVDDDFMVARIHAAFVARTAGFEVVAVAHTGAEALQAAVDGRPDLVLLDIHLPDMSGVEVLQHLAAEAADTDVLAVTAATEIETVRAALRGGVVNYLLKPFDYDALRERLEHYAASRRSLGDAPTVAQPDLDRVFGTRPASGELPPKGLSAETVEVVRRALRTCITDLSAAECARLTGLSRISARRYLEYFVTSGKAEVRLRYGAAGRPERRYAWRSGAPSGPS